MRGNGLPPLLGAMLLLGVRLLAHTRCLAAAFTAGSNRDRHSEHLRLMHAQVQRLAPRLNPTPELPGGLGRTGWITNAP